MTEITRGKLAGNAISTILEILYKLSIEAISNEPDNESLTDDVEWLLGVIENCGHDNQHRSRFAFEIGEHQKFEMELFIRVKETE